ncbi:MAG: 2OG-Fe(II) oxygenase [Acetobacteraceae bacterium]
MSIGIDLFDCLRSIERPGEFCVGGLRELLMPSIDVDGAGRISFPILPAQIERLIGLAEAAPYGRGGQTVLDRDVRRTWQIDPGKIRIGGRSWEQTLAELVAEAARGLGVAEPVEADFYKLLIYDAGSFFLDHRDTEKLPGMFATLVIVLPSAHSGGELVVRHLGREVVLDLHPEAPSEVGFAAFYADCVHEIRPIKTGFRVTLVYNLRFPNRKRLLKAPDNRAAEAQAAGLLRKWADAADAPDKLVLPMEHAYTPAELSFGTLKGVDAAVASVLTKAAAEANCDLHLALVSIEESGGAEYSDYRGHRSFDADEEDNEEFQAGEVFDRSLVLSDWRRPDGTEAQFRDFPFTDDELCPADAFADLTPDEEHFHEASGNAGASFERTYRRAGLVLWPCVRRLAVLNQAGLGATLPYLTELVANWQASGAAKESRLWREADELAAHMLGSWPHRASRGQGDTDAARMLDLLARLGNTAVIERFLATVSAEGHYIAADNEAIVRSAALLPPGRATELLVRIITRNAPIRLPACGQLLRRCIEAVCAPVGDPALIGAALLEVLPGGRAKAAADDAWPRPEPASAGFVVDILTATSRIDAGLAARAIEHLLAWPETYGFDAVLVPAALSFASEPASKAWPAVARLSEASLEHLRARIALPLEAPLDWRRTNPLRCKCADCQELGAFLGDPNRQQWRFKAALQRRSHVEQEVGHAPCDIDLVTERRGSPHTLIATKNQASYDRRVTQRGEDLQHASALGG